MRNFSLVKKFSIVLLFALVLFGFSLGKIISSALRQNTIIRSSEITANFLRHEIKNHLSLDQLLSQQPSSCYEQISERISDLNLGPNVKITHMKIWNGDRRIVWSSDNREVGKQNLADRHLKDVFNGKSYAEISPVQQLKVNFSRQDSAKEMMELFIPLQIGAHGDVEMVFEVYASVDKLMADIEHHNRIVWMSIMFGSVILYFLLFGLFWGASRRIELQNMKIRQSEDRYRNLVYCAQEGIVSADKYGRILLMNETAELIFGYSSNEARKMHFSALLLLDENDELYAQLDHFFATGNCCAIGKNFESKGQRKDGETFPLEISLSVSGEEDNCILTGLIRDITQRNRLFEQLAEAKKEWEETFDTINDAITIHDQDFNITRANEAAEKMLGQPLQTILNQKCYRSYHGTENPPVICPSCATLRSGIESTTEIYEPFLKKYLEVKALPRFDEENNLTGLVHVVRDISDRKKAEEKQLKLQSQLNQAQKMESIGRLAGGIAHDFNNILSAIIGYSELVQRELPPESKMYADINTIKEAGEKAASLTGQLLAFSRKQVLSMQPINLNSVVEDLTKILARVIGEDITLDLHFGHDLGVVVADPGQIEQVLLNLAVNARDAMPKGGHFIIETSMVVLEDDYIDQHAGAQLGPHILLAVTDTGSGITEEEKEYIFDPFFTTKEVGKGTGLGLATVYGIIKQHGGQIYVYSELEKGTTFKIYFPLAPNTKVGITEKSFDIIPIGDETILLVEDDDSVREMIKTFLEPTGYNILQAQNGFDAVETSITFEGEIHLLLTDVIMPKMNGQEVADELKKTRPEMQIIFMSGYTDDVIAHHGVLEAGVNFIQKPISLSRLAKKLREVFRNS